MPKRITRLLALVMLSVLVAASGAGTGPTSSATNDPAIAFVPLISDWAFISSDGTPPSQAACVAVNRRCFGPAAMANSYNYAVLHAAGNRGQGKTIVVVDSFGASTIRSDLGIFNTAFGLPHLCGESGPSDPSANCASTVSPRFDIVCVQGCPPPTPPPPSNGTGLENHNLWDLEVARDVEWAHATAPLANIVLLTTPTAEVLGVQGFQQMMNAETALIDSGKIDVISQSFGSGESAPGDREPGWVASGGGYSIYFDRPDYQNVLPPGSTYTGTSAGAPGKNANMRGIPDIAYQASARTGVLVYLTEPDTKGGTAGCGGANPCSTGWYTVGGTSASAPQWAGLIAIADQMAGHDLGFINPALYRIANNSAKYAADFYDVIQGTNKGGELPGYDASKGWDAVTGLGTPNAANLLPD